MTTGEGWWEIRLPLAPVPASRPRVSKWGTYYLKTYAAWRKEAQRLLYAATITTDQPVYVRIHSVCKRPQKPSKVYPRGDTDNYVKAILDAITTAGTVWADDAQVVLILATKRYAEKGEEPHTFLRATLDEEQVYYDGAPKSEDVYDLPPSLRDTLKGL